MATIGYARVSTRDQDLTIQREALTGGGCSKIYAEKITGARSDRPQLARLVKALARGVSMLKACCALDRQMVADGSPD